MAVRNTLISVLQPSVFSLPLLYILLVDAGQLHNSFFGATEGETQRFAFLLVLHIINIDQESIRAPAGEA